jgi:hypothetical protein
MPHPEMLKHAWYSAMHDAKFGHSIYLDAQRKEVKVTGVAEDIKDAAAWPDLVYVGKVSKWVAHGGNRVAIPDCEDANDPEKLQKWKEDILALIERIQGRSE